MSKTKTFRTVILKAVYLRFITPSLTVIVCTHNPRKDYLERVLDALEAQNLPRRQWELLLIDNASDANVCDNFDLSWHPAGRCIPEPELGLTHARMRGICEARADVLVFVDDDNVLDVDYLKTALEIGEKYPSIGAWGGQIRGEYEIEPPDWSKAYLPYLGIREFTKEKWSNLLHQHETTPCGVGLCVRKSVADQYVQLVVTDPRRALLGRVGSRLTSCEDTDLAFTACDLGLGTGQFPSLRAIHLIPASRLEEEYFVRLCEAIAYSHAILDSFRNKKSQITQRDDLLNEYDQSIMTFVEHRQLHQALIRGTRQAILELDALSTDND